MAKRKPKALKTMGEPQDAEALIDLFKNFDDPRVERTKDYPLDEILFLVLAAVISGTNHLTRIEVFGNIKLAWLRTMLPYENGIPSHDTIGRVLGLLDPDKLEAMFVRWMNGAAAAVEGVVAIDGKTARGAIRRGDKQAFVHMVSAFCSANSLVYGQVKVDEKSNEITAIPRLLELLSIKGALITIDAMGCQNAIVDKIVERGGDFLIAVKGNQETLQEDIGVAFHDVDIRGGTGFLSSHETEELGHGRGEWRRCEVLAAAGKITHGKKWKHVASLVRVQTERRLSRTEKPTTHTRYYISSLEAPTAEEALQATREHWSIENRLHWHLDVSLREDECRVYANNAAENLVVIRHIAMNLLKSVKGLTGGLGVRRDQAAWDDDVRVKVLHAGLK
jgi:predicted transposase YbfD/YdcC